jgi:hypothetical protein
MARPRYETEQDLDNEVKVMDAITSPYRDRVYYRKLPLAYQLDYGIYEKPGNLLRTVVEIKTRDIDIDTYKTLFISAHKVHAMIEWANMNVNAILVFNLRDGIYTRLIKSDNPWLSRPAFGGRYDREDWQDAEPVYHIPTKMFFCLGEDHSEWLASYGN